MKRKIYEKMKDWKDLSNGRSALMIDGARRVGKSWIAREFAENEYESYLIIDFSKVSKSVKRYFTDYLDNLDMFFMYLLGEYNVELKPRKSVIIFDEVQLFPRAREAIKHLVADGRYDYIETGSLISIHKNVRDILIPSEEHHLEMFPMDFEEFLWATDNGRMMPIITNAYNRSVKVGDGMHRRIMDVFRQYLVVGGMPQAVAEFASTHDLKRVDIEKRDIISLYRSDILKHGEAAKHKILAVFNSIPNAVSRHEWYFSPGAIRKGTGMRSYESTFEWLKSAMLVNVAYNAREPNVGLELSADHSSLKCFLGDTGLLVSMAFSENELSAGAVQQRLLTGRLEVNSGAIYENIVAQMLRVAGQQLYFYTSSGANMRADRMEVDFLVAKSSLQRRHNISPIEVKSVGQYQTRSLDKFNSRYGQFLNTSYVLHAKDVEKRPDRICLPLYMAGLLNT
jgi:predicted AAA+ superfamily ATPase